MSMVCPQCNATHDHLQTCPKCKVRLKYQAVLAQPSAPLRDDPDNETPWQQGPWIRIGIGLILAQGLYYGLQNLTMAGVSIGSEEPVGVWQTLGGLILSQSLQAFSLIVGGILCGAGQRQGAVYGCFLGMANGALTLLLHREQLQALASGQVIVYALPLAHVLVGALGAQIGSLVWRPIPSLPALDGTTTPTPVAPAAPLFSLHLLSGPTHLGRICIGIVVVVLGFGWSTAIMQYVVEWGNLSLASHLQAKLVSWEIAALAALVGAGYAGANTFNGFKHGLLVGIAAAFIVGMIQMGGAKILGDSLAHTVAGVVLLSIAGGWFGAQLFPPVLQRRRRRYA